MKTKTVRFLRDDSVHRVGEAPMTYEEGSVHDLREDRANYRIQNGIAVEVKPDPKSKVSNGDKVDGAADVAGKDGSDSGKRTVNDAGNGGKGKGK